MIEESKLQVPGEFDLIGGETPRIAGDWRSKGWPDPDDERIATIREEFALDEVIADAEGDLARILALKRWVRSRRDQRGVALRITLEHCMPWFDRFDGCAWEMREAPNRLEVRGGNRCGRPGSVSAIELAYAAPVW